MGRFIERLQHDTGYGKTQNNPEQRLSQCTAEDAKGQGRVRAGDKNKDRGMLDDPKTAFCFADRPRMVER